MSKIKYRVEFKTSYGKFQSKDYEFNDEGHFNNWHRKQLADESYRKIIGYERVYETQKQHSADELNQAFVAGKSTKFNTFEDWYKLYFKQTPE